MRDEDYNRKQIVRIALVVVAILPILQGFLQILHYCFWLFDWDYNSVAIFGPMKFSSASLLFTFIISIYERFCVYHRITILATLYATGPAE